MGQGQHILGQFIGQLQGDKLEENYKNGHKINDKKCHHI